MSRGTQKVPKVGSLLIFHPRTMNSVSSCPELVALSAFASVVNQVPKKQGVKGDLFMIWQVVKWSTGHKGGCG